MATFTDLTGGASSSLTDLTGTSKSWTDLTGSGKTFNDSDDEYLSDSNINALTVNAIPLNDVYPWKLYTVNAFTDLAGSGNNFVDL